MEKNKKAAPDSTVESYVQSVKGRQLLGSDGYNGYPYEKEKKLTASIISGDSPGARRYLNELLGYIFLVFSDDLQAIKLRAMELTVLMSRAAIDAGAEPDNLYSSDPKVMMNFMSLENFDEICVTLTDILNRFIGETFKDRPVKHSEVLSKAASYVNSNYMHKISLEDTAERSYISPSYLSRLFREELDTTFSEYLNRVRVEKSKLLLKSDKITVSEAAELSGFSDQSYFNKVFRRYAGVTPGYFRRNAGIEAQECENGKKIEK